MAAIYRAGDPVHTPLGKGVVREVRNGGRLLVDVGGRALEVRADVVTPREDRRRQGAQPPAAASEAEAAAPARPRQVDLHGLTVEEALVRLEDVLNEALLGGAPELRVIHGRSGGRIRAAVHVRLRAIPSVRGFSLDPRNAGVTIVRL